MSGSGPGVTSDEPLLDCEDINFITDINSPQEDALEDLEEGTILNVVLENNIIVVRRPDNDQLVGSINWSAISRLIECIEEGNEYGATIRDIRGGLVRVQITHK